MLRSFGRSLQMLGQQCFGRLAGTQDSIDALPGKQLVVDPRRLLVSQFEYQSTKAPQCGTVLKNRLIT